jgi:hypothetical protein
MSIEIERGQVGRENAWNMGQESGFIAYMRGSIGDAPVREEVLNFGESKALDDTYGLLEILLYSDGITGDDFPSFSESTTITNT